MNEFIYLQHQVIHVHVSVFSRTGEYMMIEVASGAVTVMVRPTGA